MIIPIVIPQDTCDHIHHTTQLQLVPTLTAFFFIIHLLLLAAYIRAKLQDNMIRSEFLSLMWYVVICFDALALFVALWAGIALILQKFIF